MKMPAANTIGNGYYGCGDVPYLSDGAELGNSVPVEESDSPVLDGDFSEYMWMENEEEFDKQVLQQLVEEELMEQCLEFMLDEDEHGVANQLAPESRRGDARNSELSSEELSSKLRDLSIARTSTLNPLAEEFVPSSRSNAETKVVKNGS